MLKLPVSVAAPSPPRMGMDEYACAIAWLVDSTATARTGARKTFEDHIDVPFRLVDPEDNAKTPDRRENRADTEAQSRGEERIA